ncbi:MAG: LysR family transcriptional regulator [Sphingomonadales bacterium]|nr:MAG: LysR family transcriptional regulator [Sphingomonadales bacterium]
MHVNADFDALDLSMDLRSLRHATILAEEGNYARAAGRLNITQPALSRSIQALEAEVGLKLFDRGRSGVTPTAAGELLIGEGQRLLHDQQSLARRLIDMRTGELGDVAVGFGPLAASIILPRLLIDLATNHPRLTVRTEVQAADLLIEHLESRRLDFLVVIDGLVRPSPHLTIEPLGSLPVALMARRGHPLEGGSDIQLADMRPFPIIGANAAEALKVAGPWPDIVPTIHCDDYHILYLVTCATDAIWMTSPLLDEAIPGGSALVELPIARSVYPPAYGLSIVRLAQRSPSPAVTIVMGKTREALRIERA